MKQTLSIQEQRERWSEHRRSYRADHLEKVRAAQRMRRAKRVQEDQAFVEKERKRSKEKQRRWREIHSEEERQQRREWYRLHTEGELARHRASRLMVPPEERSRRYRIYDLRRHFGLTEEDYDELVKKQDGKCAICGGPPNGRGKKNNRLVIDHDHKTGEIRGLLCSLCNVGLGHLGDSIEQLEAAVEYLKKGGHSEQKQDVDREECA